FRLAFFSSSASATFFTCSSPVTVLIVTSAVHFTTSSPVIRSGALSWEPSKLVVRKKIFFQVCIPPPRPSSRSFRSATGSIFHSDIHGRSLLFSPRKSSLPQCFYVGTTSSTSLLG